MTWTIQNYNLGLKYKKPLNTKNIPDGTFVNISTADSATTTDHNLTKNASK
jgi:hypothetical protein